MGEYPDEVKGIRTRRADHYSREISSHTADMFVRWNKGNRQGGAKYKARSNPQHRKNGICQTEGH